MGCFEPAAALDLRLETTLEHAAHEQRPLDRVGSLAGLDHLLDLVHQAGRVGDVGLGGKRN